MKSTMLARITAATAAAFCLAVPSAASASVGVNNAASFTSNGTVKDGWYWVHQDTESASWTFNITSLDAAKPGKVYLNIEALVSNKINGGSGYSARGVKFTVSCGNATQVLNVNLDNHFRPIYSGDTLGIGQTASGHSTTALRMKRFAGCTQVLIETKGAFPQQRAIGFKSTSASLGYS